MKDLAKAKWYSTHKFWTHCHLREVIKLLIDKKCKITRTQRLNLADGTDKTRMKIVMILVDELEGGLQALVKARNSYPKIEKCKIACCKKPENFSKKD